jgi:GNAT superfamily N-acetyltransferase
MSVHDGVAALYGASTIPAFRRRGVQIATIQALVEAAWQRGCDIAFTLAEPGSTSQRNLERSDFKIAYTRAKMRKVFRS